MCWTFIINMVPACLCHRNSAWTKKSAEVLSQQYNIIAMIIFCISRFICTFILRYLNAGKLLMILAIFGGIFTLGTIFLQNIYGLYCLVAVSACMSLMFPTIYGIALKVLEMTQNSDSRTYYGYSRRFYSSSIASKHY